MENESTATCFHSAYTSLVSDLIIAVSEIGVLVATELQSELIQLCLYDTQPAYSFTGDSQFEVYCSMI